MSMASPTMTIATPTGGSSDARSASHMQRRNSTDDHGIKRRAAKACLSCRHRKVRCDVVTDGPPCTNCRLDGVNCIIKKSNRGRRPAALNPRAARQVQSPTPPAPAIAPSPSPQLRPAVVATGGVPNEFFPSLYFEGKPIRTPPQKHHYNDCGCRGAVVMTRPCSSTPIHSSL